MNVAFWWNYANRESIWRKTRLRASLSTTNQIDVAIRGDRSFMNRLRQGRGWKMTALYCKTLYHQLCGAGEEKNIHWEYSASDPNFKLSWYYWVLGTLVFFFRKFDLLSSSGVKVAKYIYFFSFLSGNGNSLGSLLLGLFMHIVWAKCHVSEY
jgi:hypothetical protein